MAGPVLSLGYPENSHVRRPGSEIRVKQDKGTGECSKRDITNWQLGKTLSKPGGPEMTLWGWHRAVNPGDLTSNPSCPALSFGQVPTLLWASVFLAVKWATNRCEYWVRQGMPRTVPPVQPSGVGRQMRAVDIWWGFPRGAGTFGARAGTEPGRLVSTAGALCTQVRAVLSTDDGGRGGYSLRRMIYFEWELITDIATSCLSLFKLQPSPGLNKGHQEMISLPSATHFIETHKAIHAPLGMGENG